MYKWFTHFILYFVDAGHVGFVSCKKLIDILGNCGLVNHIFPVLACVSYKYSWASYDLSSCLITCDLSQKFKFVRVVLHVFQLFFSWVSKNAKCKLCNNSRITSSGGKSVFTFTESQEYSLFIVVAIQHALKLAPSAHRVRDSRMLQLMLMLLSSQIPAVQLTPPHFQMSPLACRQYVAAPASQAAQRPQIMNVSNSVSVILSQLQCFARKCTYLICFSWFVSYLMCTGKP